MLNIKKPNEKKIRVSRWEESEKSEENRKITCILKRTRCISMYRFKHILRECHLVLISIPIPLQQ